MYFSLFGFQAVGIERRRFALTQQLRATKQLILRNNAETDAFRTYFFLEVLCPNIADGDRRRSHTAARRESTDDCKKAFFLETV